jgi:hypothetical protein
MEEFNEQESSKGTNEKTKEDRDTIFCSEEVRNEEA